LSFYNECSSVSTKLKATKGWSMVVAPRGQTVKKESFGSLFYYSFRSNYKAMVTRSIAKGYAAWVALAKQLRLGQLLRSDDRGHCLAMVTRSAAK
jgi:uncharacterized protein YeaO (DUF488 family)